MSKTIKSTDPNDWTEAKQIAFVKKDQEHIKQIKHPSEAVQLAAVQQNGRAIQFITNPSFEVQLVAVQQYGRAIQYIKNPSLEVQLAAVQQNGYAIQYITDPSLEVQLATVQKYGWSIEFITNPSIPVQLAAVQRDGWAIQYITNPTIPVQLAAVQQYGRAIQLITNPTPLIQTAACFQNPTAINGIYPIESTNISLMKKYRDELDAERLAYLERIESESLTESTNHTDRLITLLETQQLDEISIPIPAGITNMINKVVDARERYNRDAAAKIYAAQEKAELNKKVREYYYDLVTQWKLKQNPGPGADRNSLIFQNITYGFVYAYLRRNIRYDGAKVDDKILLRVLKNPIESKLAAIDHYTPITLSILKSDRVIAQDPQFQKFQRRPQQIDLAIGDLIETLIAITCVELQSSVEGEDLGIIDTVALNNTSYAKEGNGKWYDEQTGDFVTDPKLIAILNKAHTLSNTNFAVHTVNYNNVNYTKDPKTGAWISANNTPVEKTQTQLISILDDLLAHKTGSNGPTKSQPANTNSPNPPAANDQK